MGRNRILMIVAVVGVVAGFAVVRLWKVDEAPAVAGGNTVVPVAVETGTAPATSGSGTAPSTSLLEPPRGRGSSMTVVGGMSRQEMIQRGIIDSPELGTGSAAPIPPRAPGGGERMTGTPAAIQFPREVGMAASRFMCLCGCGHRLDECPCNDQPIGAVTMLSYLQQLMQESSDPAVLAEEMVDRYGDQVLVSPLEP
jgi:hypothetical protein